MLRSDGAGGDLSSCGETRTAADDDDAAAAATADVAVAAATEEEEEEVGTTPAAARELKRRSPERVALNERMPGRFR